LKRPTDEDTLGTENLSPRQEQAIIALLNEPTVKRAAEVSNIGYRTIHRWLEEPAFAKVYRRARRQAFAQAVSLTQRYAPLAVQTLAKAMNDADAPYAVRVHAAVYMLKFSRESIELDDLASRVDDLEARASGGNQIVADSTAHAPRRQDDDEEPGALQPLIGEPS
ncbi:MAG: hypothetical protein H7Y88_03055, partial [Phycisphaerales bacterium]|nr:hypothetical protein [Phycisphaerales bacterium]